MELKSIIFIVVLILIIYILFRYMFQDINTLQQNVVNGQNLTTIQASSLATNGTGASTNNFAYSIWFYVNDWNYRYGEPKVVYGRMGKSSVFGSSSLDAISGLDPCPAVVLGAIENNLSIALGCYPGLDSPATIDNSTPEAIGGCAVSKYGCCPDKTTAKTDFIGSECPAYTPTSVVHTCNVSNVPIQKWVNLLISVYGRTLDVYLDGKLVKTCLLPGIAMVNSNANVYITPKGGFNGWTSKFQYWSNSLNPQDAWNIYTKGYGSSVLGNLFGSYQVQVSVLENGTVSNSIKI